MGYLVVVVLVVSSGVWLLNLVIGTEHERKQTIEDRPGRYLFGVVICSVIAFVFFALVGLCTGS